MFVPTYIKNIVGTLCGVSVVQLTRAKVFYSGNRGSIPSSVNLTKKLF